MENKLLSIGVLSKLTGIHIKSLHYYEDIGILKPAYINPESKYRYYGYQQVAVVMAIHLCVVLDIPLRDFHHYISGETILYEKLIQDGKSLIEKKLHDMHRALDHLNLTIDEMQLAEDHLPGEIYLRTGHEKTVLTNQLEHNYNQLDNTSISKLFEKASELGLETGYEIGHYSEYIKGRHHYYSFLEVNAAQHTHPDLVRFPAGMYACILGTNVSLNKIPAAFAKMLNPDNKAIIIETELFTKQTQTKKPIIELRMTANPET